MNGNGDLLTGVSSDELESLAAGVLFSSSQSRLDELVTGAKSHLLSANEEAELHDLLHKVDQLNLLKRRVRCATEHLGTQASNP